MDNISIDIAPKLMSPGISNAEYPHCVALTYFQGQQIIAYGSGNKVIIASNTLSIIDSLERHRTSAKVTAVAWAPYSGRLSSAADDLRIIIWAPTSSGWTYSYELQIDFIPICLSWSLRDHIFCVAGDKFNIYSHEINFYEDSNILHRAFRCVYSEETPTTFVSHSRDSRFIMALPESKNDIFIYYKRAKTDYEYSRVILTHPSPVVSARWRTTDNVHERCCFMTVCADHVVRIWAENSVNEPLIFSVVAALPSKLRIIAASFLVSTSKSVTNNPLINTRQKKKYFDKYAGGHGHFIIRDQNTRDAKIADSQELQRNRFWFITFNKKQKMTIWEVSGMAADVRRTPKISKILTHSVLLGIEPSFVNHIFSYCRLENEYSHFSNKNFIGRPSSMTLFLQNRVSKVLTTVDILVRQKISVSQIINLHGHDSDIESIRLNQSYPYMVTVDKNKNPIIWGFNDTDVYDPSLLAKFICQVKVKLEAVDWLTSADLIGYDGTKFVIIQVHNKMSPIYSPSLKTLECPTELPKAKILQFRVLCAFNAGYIFYIHFTNDIYVMYLNQDELVELLHTKSDDDYVDSAHLYITQLLPYAGATLLLAATQHELFSIVMNTSTMLPKGHNRVLSTYKCLEIPDDIRGICFTHPGYIFIACKNVIHFARRPASTNHEIKIIQTIPINFDPREIRSNPNGMLSLIGPDRIELYHQFRESTLFNESNLKWKKFASYSQANVSAIEWSLDGILCYSVKSQIFAFTKYMDTFFIKSPKMMATIHNTMSTYSKSIMDFSPSILIPLLISGRTNLLLKMLDYMNTHFDDIGKSCFYQDYVLGNSEESKKIYEGNVKELIESLREKIFKYQGDRLCQSEEMQFYTLLDNLPKILAIPPESLDIQGMTAARAFALSEKHMIPFDLIDVAYTSQDQTKLIDFINFNEWESILNSAVLYWVKDLSVIENKLVQFSINNFDEKRDLSIFILVITRKFFVLKTLFKKAGDDTRAQFFVRDFNREKEKKSAEKNGYSALSKTDYYIAVAMFFLAGKIETAVRLIMQNLKNLQIAFFVCRCFENGCGNATTHFIDEILIPEAKKANDLAAIEFFNRQKNPSMQFNLTDRYRCEIVGNLNKTSNYFCDCRFVSAETFRTTPDQKTDLILCFLLSGLNFLATIYLSHLNNFVLDEEDIQCVKSSISFEHLASGKMVSFDEDLSMSESHSNEQIMIEEIDEFSFGYTGGDMLISDSSFYSSSDEKESESELHYRSQTDIPSLLNPSPSMLMNPTDMNPINTSHHYTDGKLYKLEAKSNHKRKKSIEPRTAFKNSLKRSTSHDLNAVLQTSRFYHDVDSEGFDDTSESESNDQVANWLMIVAVFNTARLRLESFMATQFDLSNGSTSLIYQKIIEGGSHLGSMLPQLNEYLIRSCKRNGIVLRRLLLIATEHEKNKYLEALCSNMVHLPDQMLAFKFTSQQIAQISRTTQVLVRCINRQLIKSLEHNPIFPYIIASVATSIFIVAVSNHNPTLMYELLNLNLNKLTKFPDEIEQLLNVDMETPNAFSPLYKCPHQTIEHNYISFIAESHSTNFIHAKSFPLNCLSQFASSLIDFLLVDTFIKNIHHMKNREPKYFSLLLTNLQKCHDICIQLFTYTTLNFPIFLEFNSIMDICQSEDRELNKLVQFLFSTGDRNRVIRMFCTNMLEKYTSKVNNSFSLTYHQNPNNENTNKLNNKNDNYNQIEQNKEEDKTDTIVNTNPDKAYNSNTSDAIYDSNTSDQIYNSNVSDKMYNSKASETSNNSIISDFNYESRSENQTGILKSGSTTNIKNEREREIKGFDDNDDFEQSEKKEENNQNENEKKVEFRKLSNSQVIPQRLLPTPRVLTPNNTKNNVKRMSIRERRSSFYTDNWTNGDFNKKNVTSVSEQFVLKKPKIRESYRTPVLGMCINKDSTIILIATNNGVKSFSHSCLSKNTEEIDESDESMSLIVNFDGEMSTSLSIPLIGTDVDGSISMDSLSSIPVKSSEDIKELTKSNSPVCVAASPLENAAIVGDMNGKVWMCLFGEKVSKKFDFTTPKNVSCNSVAFASSGNIFAAAHSNKVSLWSLCQNKIYSKPFRVIDTYSNDCMKVDFAQGTGLLITAQEESSKFKANLAFWDILIPEQSSMVASLKIHKKWGKITSMIYSPRFSQVIVGTKKGNICVVDTRQLQVINSWQCFQKKQEYVQSMALDPNQMFFATGSNEGKLMIWDMQTSEMLSELKNIHKTKSYQSKGDINKYSISSMVINNNVVYTGGFDGYIKSSRFSM
ncbi:hypothetical protein TRFO_02254 [Tritrichomonas foetus]|uniref:RAVE complex protein Rav1 C-terminal domain-containing protein n=1 Tax=Tritrichomonas foetus TaxID=1144522 RepID=A0A1J4J9B5_9EUKA|nr:hypothetical protein TRFO_02254 [Tritrichomonas foetus]|eukprot:OHS95265.1 hypothetical protein TRFO_02254 [Tritrichomonas foetus]